MPFRVKFSSMSESTQTLQANLCYVKRCSCVVFSLKARRKDLINRHESLPPPHPPSPSVPPNDVKRILAGFCCPAQGVHISCIQIQHFFRREEQWGVGWRSGGCGERTVGLFVKSFLPAFKEKNNTGTSFHITQGDL